MSCCLFLWQSSGLVWSTERDAGLVLVSGGFGEKREKCGLDYIGEEIKIKKNERRGIDRREKER